METHTSYDFGVTRIIFGDNKCGRVKTICGKQVSYSRIDDMHPTCETCKETLEESAAMANLLGDQKVAI